MSDAKVKKLADLSLLLLFLSGWEEESRQFPGEKIFRAWKGFLFTTLNDLCENNFLTQFKNTKSVILTPAGIERAKKLATEFGVGL